MTGKDFAQSVFELASTITGYQIGKSGQNGFCDCIGLIMGAMGKSYPLHSTNYFARFQMKTLSTLSNQNQLVIGHLVYKAREDTAELNERYQHGGRYYKEGDLLDYYHVGVVTDLNPLEITHCTSTGNISGIKRDGAIKGWTHFGELMGVDYAAATITEDATEDKPMPKTAYVKVPSGTSTANMRTKPNRSSQLLKRVPAGTPVTVIEQADGWSHITDPEGVTGYMMSEFLNVLEYADEEELQTAEVVSNDVSIVLPREAAAALFKALSEVAF